MGKNSQTAKTAKIAYVEINGSDLLAQLWRIAYAKDTASLRSSIPSLAQAKFGSLLSYLESRPAPQSLITQVYVRSAAHPVDPAEPVQSASLPGLGQRFFNSAPGQRVTYASTQSLPDVPRPVQMYLKNQNLTNLVQNTAQRRKLRAKVSHEIQIEDSAIYNTFTPYLGKTLDDFRGFSDRHFLLMTDNMRTVLNLIGDLEAVFTAWRPLYDNKTVLDHFFRLIHIISARFDDGIVHRGNFLKKARTNNSVSTNSNSVEDCLKNCVAWRTARNQFFASALPVIELMNFWAAAEQLLEKDPSWHQQLEAIDNPEQKAEIMVNLALSARQHLLTNTSVPMSSFS